MSIPRYIFLDQNHWIYLAKAIWGRPHRTAHTAASEELLRRVDCDEIRLPLSILHLIEHMNAEEPGRRQRLAEVLERFSRGWFFAAWSDILPVEIARAVDQTFGTSSLPPPAVFGRGFMFGVGTTARAAFLPEWTQMDLQRFAWLAAQPGALLDLLTFPNESGRARQKQRISEVSRRNAEAAEALRAARRPYAKSLLRRAQYAGYTYELQERVGTALTALGKTFDDFIGLGVDGLIEFWSKVPSLDVDCELTVYRDRQWSRSVDENDVRDIGHLAIAIPYCNAVVVERLWARAIQETRLDQKYGVRVSTDLMDLVERLDG